MIDTALPLVALAVLLLAAGLLFEGSRIYAEAGLRPFIWPRFRHGYDIGFATRIALAPWALAFACVITNGLAIMLLERDLLGQRADGYGYWLAAGILPIGMAHLIDHRRSILAALATFLLLAAGMGLAFHGGFWWLGVLAVPLVVWSLNGLRATIAWRAHG